MEVYCLGAHTVRSSFDETRSLGVGLARFTDFWLKVALFLAR
jgi:hypothetical protein